MLENVVFHFNDDRVAFGLDSRVLCYLKFFEEFWQLSLQVFEAGFCERFFDFFFKKL